MIDLTTATTGEVLADLILHGAQICGKPVELIWPDGLPPGMTRADVANLARSL